MFDYTFKRQSSGEKIIVSAVGYYRLYKAIAATVSSNYLIAYQISNGHKFLLFKSFEDFLKVHKFGKEPYHEIMIYPDTSKSIDSQCNRKDGRLCFDFDLVIANNDDFNVDVWKSDIEWTIKHVCNLIYKNIDIEKLIFVWSKSPDQQKNDNSKKISRHLTMKNLFLEDWIVMGRQFYKSFSHEWNKKFLYIEAEKFLDHQIIKKNGCLRFVGSPKSTYNHHLSLENNEHVFVDSLIRPPIVDFNEQHVTYNNLIVEPKTDFLNVQIVNINLENVNNLRSIKNIKTYNAKSFDVNNILDAFEIYDEYENNGEYIIKYQRKKPSDCIICKRYHQKDNAFVKIVDGIVTYYCWRNLSQIIQSRRSSFFIFDNVLPIIFIFIINFKCV